MGFTYNIAYDNIRINDNKKIQIENSINTLNGYLNKTLINLSSNKVLVIYLKDKFDTMENLIYDSYEYHVLKKKSEDDDLQFRREERRIQRKIDRELREKQIMMEKEESKSRYTIPVSNKYILLEQEVGQFTSHLTDVHKIVNQDLQIRKKLKEQGLEYKRTGAIHDHLNKLNDDILMKEFELMYKNETIHNLSSNITEKTDHKIKIKSDIMSSHQGGDVHSSPVINEKIKNHTQPAINLKHYKEIPKLIQFLAKLHEGMGYCNDTFNDKLNMVGICDFLRQAMKKQISIMNGDDNDKKKNLIELYGVSGLNSTSSY